MIDIGEFYLLIEVKNTLSFLCRNKKNYLIDEVIHLLNIRLCILVYGRYIYWFMVVK